MAFLLAAKAPAQKTFPSPEQAAEALIDAAERFDVAVLKEIFGPDGIDLVVTEDAVQDKNTAQAFAAQAREMTTVSKDSDKAKRAILAALLDDRDRHRPDLAPHGEDGAAPGGSTPRPGDRSCCTAASGATSSTRSRCAAGTSRHSTSTP